MRSNAQPCAARAAIASSRWQLAANIIAQPDGPRVAVMEAGGWDTHASQGAPGVLAIACRRWQA